MPGKSNYLADKILDHVVGGSTYTPPAQLFFALFNTTPADDGTGGTEVSTGGTAYARAAVANNLTQFPAASGQSKSNQNDVVYATATASWGTINGAGVYDAVTAGNLLYVNALVAAKTVDSGDTARFPAGTLIWTED